MKRSLLAAAVGAVGALGTVGLMAATPAQAAPGDATCSPALLCSVRPSLDTFLNSINPAANLNTLINGTDTTTCVTDTTGEHCQTTNDGLGLKDQPATFAASVADFLSGPRLPS
jgi:hypothetical protein